MKKEEVYKFIKNRNIWYEVTEHEAFEFDTTNNKIIDIGSSGCTKK